MLFLACWVGGVGTLAAQRERLPFDAHWRFTHDDPPGVDGKLDYANVKAALLSTGVEFQAAAAAAPFAALPGPVEGHPGEDVPYVRIPLLTTTRWRTFNLPHDWGIEGPFKQEYSRRHW